MCVCARVCMCGCVFVCKCVCVCVSEHAYVHVCVCVCYLCVWRGAKCIIHSTFQISSPTSPDVIWYAVQYSMCLYKCTCALCTIQYTVHIP